MTWPCIDHSLLSPSGHVSKRARKVALKREAEKLFPAGTWDKLQLTENDREHDLRWAAELRSLAERGMRPRKYRKMADELERRWQQ